MSIDLCFLIMENMFHRRCQVWLQDRWSADMLFSVTRQTPTVRRGERTWWVVVSAAFLQGKWLYITVFTIHTQDLAVASPFYVHQVSAFFSCVYPQCCTATAWQACCGNGKVVFTCNETILVIQLCSCRRNPEKSGGYSVGFPTSHLIPSGNLT